jgi:hypothetical protein
LLLHFYIHFNSSDTTNWALVWKTEIQLISQSLIRWYRTIDFKKKCSYVRVAYCSLISSRSLWEIKKLGEMREKVHLNRGNLIQLARDAFYGKRHSLTARAVKFK